MQDREAALDVSITLGLANARAGKTNTAEEILDGLEHKYRAMQAQQKDREPLVRKGRILVRPSGKGTVTLEKANEALEADRAERP